jgi:hypothetical protein
MDRGARVVLDAGRIVQASAYRLTPEGEVDKAWSG